MSRTSLSFLTWNLALLERSDQAPPGWDMEHTEAAVRELVLEVGPDLVLLQELPGLVPFVETHAMVPANPRSHSGNLATLCRHEIMTTDPPTVTTVPGCALLTTFAGMGLTVANVHLAPGRASAGTRLQQLGEIVEAAPAVIAVIGDTNMRVDELVAVRDAGLVSDNPPTPTWDSRRNRFRAAAPEFSAYFTRWIAAPGVAVREVGVHEQPITAHGKRFHLSDHFAMTGTLELVVS